MNNKGFLLTDALVNVLVVTLLSILCISTFKMVDNFKIGYLDYIKQSNEKYEYLYSQISECLPCQITTDLPQEA